MTVPALVKSSFPSEVRPALDTVGVYGYDGRLNSAVTAHPKLRPVTGEPHFFDEDDEDDGWLLAAASS